uniref:Uncharacterized protein n=1 Tax=Aegilops tauschii TaxID=37682 RepID=R7W7K1_AEGTA
MEICPPSSPRLPGVVSYFRLPVPGSPTLVLVNLRAPWSWSWSTSPPPWLAALLTSLPSERLAGALRGGSGVEVRSGSEGYIVKMRDGKNLRCVHNNSQGREIPESAPQPAIVLRIEDGSGTLLPIIVLEMPSVLLMAAIRHVHIARPTIYQVVKELIDKMGYEVKLVRVNKRIEEAYCAELYLTKIGDQTESITFDLRPSDAINIAVRCKVPIQVHRSLAYSDGIRSVEPAKLVATGGLSDGLLFTELDRPDGEPCVEAQEFSLVRNMFIAVVEERYKDAATWKDKLMRLRSKRKNWA